MQPNVKDINMWQLYALPIAIAGVYFIFKYPCKFFGSIEKIDAKFREWVEWIIK